MRTPTIHQNGTSKEELIDQTATALHAVRDAITKVGEAVPYGRDYYTQGDDAISQALREHEARINELTAVANEIEMIFLAIADQVS